MGVGSATNARRSSRSANQAASRFSTRLSTCVCRGLLAREARPSPRVNALLQHRATLTRQGFSTGLSTSSFVPAGSRTDRAAWRERSPGRGGGLGGGGPAQSGYPPWDSQRVELRGRLFGARAPLLQKVESRHKWRRISTAFCTAQLASYPRRSIGGMCFEVRHARRCPHDSSTTGGRDLSASEVTAQFKRPRALVWSHRMPTGRAVGSWVGWRFL